MRNKPLATLIAAVALAVGLPVGQSAAAPPSPIAVAAKSCPPGFVKGTIDGATKCLHGGEYCKRSAERQYERYGFRCVGGRLRSN
jgi:hypothetical protein